MGFWTFVLVAVTISTLATIVNNWIKARHGYPIEDEQATGRIVRQLAATRAENQELKSRVHALEQRLRVIERITTDPGERTAREIEALRDT